MADLSITSLLILLAILYIASFLFNLALSRLHMPSLLAPLLAGLLAQGIPYLSALLPLTAAQPFALLAQLGIVFLLLNVGIQLSVDEMRGLSFQIVILAALNLAASTALGYVVLAWFGYPPFVSLIVSTALATVAETTICPILDEMGVIKSKVACLILGTGVIDDVVEILIASAAVMYVGSGQAESILVLGEGLLIFVALTTAFYFIVLPLASKFTNNLEETGMLLLIISTGIIFSALTVTYDLGVLLGAVTAGLVLQRLNDTHKIESSKKVVRGLAYGLLGPVFFFGIGAGVSLGNFSTGIWLTVLLIIANFLGKLVSAIAVAKMVKLNWQAAITIGLGLSAKFSMGIIPVQILYSAAIIDSTLFSSFIAVCTITTIIIPFTLGYLLRKWRGSIN